MRGLIETAIEREADRLDEVLEASDLVPPLFAPRHFRSRLNLQSRKFASRGTWPRRLATTPAPKYLN